MCGAATDPKNSMTQGSNYENSSSTPSSNRDGSISLVYVNRLIGRDTISSMSLNTADAYRDHGTAAPTVERNLLEALAQLGDLETVGINLDRVSAQLERESIGATAAGVNTAFTRLASAA
jgi:transaldolase